MKYTKDEDDYLLELGNYLKNIRTDKNLSQQTVGDMLGVTHQQIHLYESGKNQIPITKLRKLLNIYNVNLFWENSVKEKGTG